MNEYLNSSVEVSHMMHRRF